MLIDVPFLEKYEEYFYFDYELAEYRPREDKETPQEALEEWARYINTIDYMKRRRLR